MHPRRPFQRQGDAVHDAAEVDANLAGPNAQHTKAVPLEDAVANRVVLGLPVFGVLEAVDLDHEPARVADEVEIVASEGRLAANLEATLAETLEA